MLQKYLKKREILKEKVKDSTILKTLALSKKEERAILGGQLVQENKKSKNDEDSIEDIMRNQKFVIELFHLYNDIETKFMTNESKEMDELESNLVFIRT